MTQKNKLFISVCLLVLALLIYGGYYFKSKPRSSDVVVDSSGRQYTCNNINIMFKDQASESEINQVVESVNATVLTDLLGKPFNSLEVIIPGECSDLHTQAVLVKIRKSQIVEIAEPNFINSMQIQ